jgi:nicotinate-nucleotide--dimethylbenzimidazole phosphoribosyltransferase
MIDPASVQAHLANLIKPNGSLGDWERLAERLCLTQQTLHPIVRPVELIVFAADHGVVTEGVGLWPSDITTMMVEQIATGRSASGVLAQLYDIKYLVVDVGTINPSRIEHDRLIVQRVAAGTRNLAHQPAMSLHEMRDALAIGAQHAKWSLERGARVVIVGEMGIGNTTSASCIARVLADIPIELCIGNGAGANAQTLAKKIEVVTAATDRVLQRCGRSIDEAAIAEICGYEIAAMAGYYVQAAKQHQTILLDGMIATAAALIAQQFYPEVSQQMIASHLSSEPAHAIMLERLGLIPFLDWSMRLGEGTGAIALFPLLEGAAAWSTQMSSLDELR